MNKLAIVGGSPSSEMDAPFGQEGYDIWVLANRLSRYNPEHISLAFEIHNDLSCYDEGYAERIAGYGVPLCVSNTFPIDGEHIEKYGLSGNEYLTSSISYMLVMGIYLRYKHIDIYGVDMAVDNHEYFYQRPCMEYWIGYARGKGIEVVLPDNCTLCKSTFLYGVDDHNNVPDYINANEYAEMAEKHRQRQNEAIEALNKLPDVERLKAIIHAHGGAAEAYDKMAQVKRAVDSGQDIKTIKGNVSLR